MSRFATSIILGLTSAALVLTGTVNASAQQNSAERRDASYQQGALVGGTWHAQTRDSKSSLIIKFLAGGKVEAVFSENGEVLARMSGSYTYDADSGKLALDLNGKGFETTVRWTSATRLTMTGTSGNQGEWVRKDS